MAETVQALITAMEKEARRAPFPVDEPVYTSAGLDPSTCILYAGALDADVAFFARDLGRDEVRAQQPLVGAAGRLVRAGVYRAVFGREPAKKDDLAKALDHALFTNTVPWKPPGNKAYSDEVKNRFRPFVARFLVRHWKGTYVITLGTEAFEYFAPYAPKGALKGFWKRPDKWENEIKVTVPSDGRDGSMEREITLAPLPHPSPLNKKFYPLFPAMIDARLTGRFRRR